MTICAQGARDVTLHAGFYNLFLNYLRDKNVTMNANAYAIADYLRQVYGSDVKLFGLPFNCDYSGKLNNQLLNNGNI